VSGDGGPQHIRGTGGRCQGRGGATRSASVDAWRGSDGSPDAGISAAGARPPGPM